MSRQTLLNGFTLIEMIIVIIIVGIVSVSITRFYVSSMEAYISTEARNDMTTSARLALERMGRDVREAMPNSLRVNTGSGSNCLEFVPTVGATYYIDLPISSAATSMRAIDDVRPSTATDLYAMVMPLNQSEVYNTAAGFSALVASIGNTSPVTANVMQVNFAASSQFVRESAQQRLFFVRQPVSYCVVGNDLIRYTNYGFQITQPTSLTGGARLTTDVLLNDGGSAVIPFVYSPGTLNRAGLLEINLHLSGRDESISLKHEVHVRNVP